MLPRTTVLRTLRCACAALLALASVQGQAPGTATEQPTLQDFFDAYRAGDEEAMARFAAVSVDPIGDALTLWRSALRASEGPGESAAFLDAAIRLAELSAEHDEGAGLQRLVASWRSLDPNQRDAAKRICELVATLQGDTQAGKSDPVIESYVLAKELIRQLPDDLETSQLHFFAGWAYSKQERYAEALAAYREAARIARAIPDRRRLAGYLTHVGAQQFNGGDVQGSLASFREELELLEGLGASTASVLCNLGNGYLTIGRVDQAITFFDRALERCDAKGDSRVAVAVLVGLAGSLWSAGEIERSLSTGRRAIKLAEEIGADDLLSPSLLGHAKRLSQLQRFEEAQRVLERALALVRKMGSRSREAEALIVRASLDKQLERRPEARDGYEAARAIYADLGLPISVAECDVWIAGVQHETGDSEGSRRRLRAALPILENAGLLGSVVTALSSLGDLELSLGNLELAESRFRQALELQERLGNAKGKHFSLHAIARVRRAAGEFQRALDLAERCVRWARQSHYPKLEGMALELMSSIHLQRGNFPAALRALEPARAAFAETPDSSHALRTERTRANILFCMGRWSECLEMLEGQLANLRRQDRPLQIARTLRCLADFILLLGDDQRATVYLEEAIRLFRQAGDGSGTHSAQITLGKICLRAGRTPEAIATLESALQGQTGLTRRLLAQRLLARALREAGRSEDSLQHATEAVEDARRVGDPSLEMSGLVELALSLAAAGQHDRAFVALQRASEIEEESRHGEGAIQFVGCPLAHLLFDMERFEEALEMNRPALARLVDDVQQLGSRESVPLREHIHEHAVLGIRAATAVLDRPDAPDGTIDELLWSVEMGRSFLVARAILNHREVFAALVPPALVEAATTARARVANCLRRRAALRTQHDPEPEAAATIAAELHAAEGELAHAVARIQRTRSLAANLVSPDPVTSTDIREHLGPDAAYVAFQFAGDDLFALVVTSEQIEWCRLGPRAEIDAALGKYQRIVSTPGTDERDLARQLYEALWKPLEPHFGAARRVLVSPDGALAFLPFEALLRAESGTSRRLIESYEIVLEPSATTAIALHDLGADLRGSGIVALGDPVYAGGVPVESVAVVEPGLRRRGLEKLQRLPATGDEVRSIAALFGADDSKVLLRSEASREQLVAALQAREKQLAVLHLACHGYVDDERPWLTGLVLSGPEVLSLHDICLLQVPADLVVLSACDSGRGTLVGGDGVLGLVRGFFLAGALRVVVANWRIDDDDTRAFMVRFYERILVHGDSPASALRTVKLERLRAGGPNAHPARWAAFVLWGLWD